MRDGGAEERHHRIADELLDRAAVSLELATEACMVRTEHCTYVFRIELLGLRREADKVAEEDGDDLALSRAATSGASDAPHIPHRRKPSGFSWPQLGQLITRREYGVSAE